MPNLDKLAERPRLVILLIAGYFSLMAVQLALFRPGGRSDDTEALLLAQSLEWGYEGKNPPLFYWLTFLGGQVLEPSTEVVYLLRMAALVLLFVGLYRLARLLQPDPLIALAAGLAPLLVPQFHWYAFNDLTHTLLAGVAYVWALILTLELGRRPGALRFGLLGLVIVAGLYAKYVFVAFAVALLAAVALSPAHRRLLLDARILITLAVVIVLGLPHGLWMIGQLDAFEGQMTDSLGLESGGVLDGLANLGEALGTLLLGPIVVVLLLLRPAFKPIAVPDDRRRSELRLTRNLMLISCLLLLAGVFAGLRRVEPHHLFFLVFFPVWLVARLDAASVAMAAVRRLLAVTLALVVGVAASFGPLTIHKARTVECGRCSEFMPYEAYARTLRAEGFEGGTLVSLVPRRLVNLTRLSGYIPGTRIVDPRYRLYMPPRLVSGDCLVVWREGDRGLLEQFDLPVPAGEGPAEPVRFGVLTGDLLYTDRPAPPLYFALIDGGVDACP
jgi:4-amino-4-deoxy-L-arabinose transferase-like glycosyltransferase